MTPTSILLRGGTVLTHGNHDQVIPVSADVLIQGNKIAKIAPNIEATAGTVVVQCADKILSPGFIDTHHHLWQSLLKGRHANESLVEYFPSGNFPSSLHSAEDIFWAQLAGALECLDAGTTTVVDHSHMNYSPEHAHAALAGTISSGLRSVYCYCPTPRLDSWEPFGLNQDLLAPWVLEAFEEMANNGPYGDGRVTIGFAFDGLHLPKEIVAPLFSRAKSLGIKVITLHYVGGAFSHGQSITEKLEAYGLLDSTILFSHATNIPLSDVPLIKSANAHISSTPSTELQMMGTPMAFSTTHDIQSHSSLGIDCHSATSGSLVSEMRLLLQSARGAHNEQISNAGKIPHHVNKTVLEAFNLATISGARAINEEAQIGSLAEGKLADIIIFDALSPAMVGAAQQDPVAAVVLHSSPADIDMLIIDGVIRKQNGKLSSVEIAPDHAKWAGDKETLVWADVAKEIMVRRKGIADQLSGLDMVKGYEGAMKAFYLTPDVLADSV